MDRCTRVFFAMSALLGVSLILCAGSAVARTIFTLRGVPPATGVVALPDGSIVATTPSDTGPVPGGVGTWSLEPNGDLRELSSHGGLDVTVGPDGARYVTQGASVYRLSPSGDASPVATGLMSPIGISARPDGTLLVADLTRNQVVSVSQDGTMIPVAGTGESGFSGDGGPATAARLSSPVDVAATADGGFLIADSANERVRKVDANGIISTVAGSGVNGALRDGIRATDARISVSEVVAGRHGGFAFAGGVQVRRVTRDGIIRTVAGGRGLFSDAVGMGIWNGDGGNAKRARLDYDGFGLAVTAGDDYMLAGRASVRFVPAPSTPRLAVAARVLLPARRRLSYVVTRAATLRLELRGLRKRIVLVHRAEAGRGRFRLPRSLPPGPYLVRLQAHGADGQRASQRLGMFHGRRLSRRVALAAARAGSGPLVFPRGRNRLRLRRRTAEDNPVGPCRRMSKRRFDCRIWVEAVDAPRECVWHRAILLDTRWGQLGSMDYLCGAFRQRPPDPFGPGLIGIIARAEGDFLDTAPPFPAPPADRPNRDVRRGGRSESAGSRRTDHVPSATPP